MIQFHDEQNRSKLVLMQLLFNSYDNCSRSSKSFQEGLKFCCQKPTKYGQIMIYEAVKVDMANSKETSFNNTISSTLSHHCVIWRLIWSHHHTKGLRSEKESPKAFITSLNKTDSCDGYDFNVDIINNDEYNALQKNCWCCLRGFASLVFGNSLKTCFVFWWKKTRPCIEVMKMFKKNWTICIQNHAYVMWHLQLCWMTSWQIKTIVSINHQWIELQLLCQWAYLCMEQYTWIHAISSKMHAEWFFYPSNCKSHILDRTTWLDRTTPFYGISIT